MRILRKPGGKYSLRLTKDEYFDFEVPVEVENGKESVVSAELQRSVAGVSIGSRPSRAHLFLNGESAGMTPWRSDNLPPGEYAIRLDRALHKSVEETRTVTAGAALNWVFELPPNYGSILVQSNISGAAIKLDGKATGQTAPHTFEQLRTGTHEVELTKPGHGTRRMRVVVKTLEVTGAELNLDARLGTVSVTTKTADGRPCRGTVIVDGTPTEHRTPWRGKLIAVEHTIKVDCDGRTGIKTVAVPHNGEVEIPITVESFGRVHLAEARSKYRTSRNLDYAAWGVGGAGVIVGSNFLYKMAVNFSMAEVANQGIDFQGARALGRSQRTMGLFLTTLGTGLVTAGIYHRRKVTASRQKRLKYVLKMVPEHLLLLESGEPKQVLNLVGAGSGDVTVEFVQAPERPLESRCRLIMKMHKNDWNRAATQAGVRTRHQAIENTRDGIVLLRKEVEREERQSAQAVMLLQLAQLYHEEGIVRCATGPLETGWLGKEPEGYAKWKKPEVWLKKSWKTLLIYQSLVGPDSGQQQTAVDQLSRQLKYLNADQL
jgi:hypothetical protein